jgi:hypothetical protein
MTNLISLRTLLGLSVALAAVACTSRSRSIDVPTPKPVNSDDEVPTNEDDGKNADVTLSIPQEIAQKYLDPNAKTDYKFKYLDVEQDGEVQFTGGNAVIQLTALPSGLEGTMELSIFEAGVVKLQGKQDGVKLNVGGNKLTLTLTPVDGGTDTGTGGSNDADLDLQIVVDDGSGTNTATGTGTGTSTATGGAPTFASIKAITVKSCFGSCHYHSDEAADKKADTEKFWTSRGKDLLVGHIAGTLSVMPPPDTTESKALTDAERQLLVDYANTL